MKYYLPLIAAIFIFTAYEAKADCGHGRHACMVSPPGEQGEQGEQGPKGDKGDTGDTGKQGIAGINGQNGDVGTNSISSTERSTLLSGYADESYVDGMTAGFMAVSSIDVSNSTSSWQVGVGLGYYESENAIALGVGKLLPNRNILFKGTLTNINSENAYGAGLMWKIK